MGVYRTNGALSFAKKEASFGAGATFASEDIVETTDGTSIKPEVSNIERKVKTASFVARPGMAGKESATATFETELIPKDATAGDGIMGEVLLEVTAGIRVAKGATIDSANHKIVDKSSDASGDAVLYKLNKPCGSQESLAIKRLFGCSTSDSKSLSAVGCIPKSVKFNIPTADISTATYELEGIGFATADGEDVPAYTPVDVDPYVGKNVVFKVDGTIKDAKDVSFTLTNETTDIEAITGSGVSAKVVISKTISGSLSLQFDGWDELNKFKSNTDAELYVELDNGTRVFALYFPKIRYKSVSVEDDSGVLVNKIEFNASEDDNGEAILIAHK